MEPRGAGRPAKSLGELFVSEGFWSYVLARDETSSASGKGSKVTRHEQFRAERRKHPRHPIEAQVTVLFSEFWEFGDVTELFGWTHNVSQDGVCFSLPYLIPNEELVLHIDYEGMGAEYVLVRVVGRQDSNEEGFKYHCRIDRMISSLDALGCLDELLFDPLETLESA